LDLNGHVASRIRCQSYGIAGNRLNCSNRPRRGGSLRGRLLPRLGLGRLRTCGTSRAETQANCCDQQSWFTHTPVPKHHLDASPRYLSTLVLMTIACTNSRATQTRDSCQPLDVFRGESRFTGRLFPAEMRVAIGQQLDVLEDASSHTIRDCTTLTITSRHDAPISLEVTDLLTSPSAIQSWAKSRL